MEKTGARAKDRGASGKERQEGEKKREKCHSRFCVGLVNGA